ncbi:hypothetical protein LXN10_11625 [Arcobacter sp. KX21116]|uniref:hypothetical protein n=1 Tax=Arcobacter iocasae TaxID=2906515 RepID=UPI0035D4FD48
MSPIHISTLLGTSLTLIKATPKVRGLAIMIWLDFLRHKNDNISISEYKFNDL